YTWDDFAVTVADLPTAWLARLTPQPRPEHDHPARTAPPGGTKLGKHALSSELARIGQAREGHRSNTLLRGSCRMGQLIHSGDLHHDPTFEALVHAGEYLDLPHRKTIETVNRGLAWGQDHPRSGS